MSDGKEVTEPSAKSSHRTVDPISAGVNEMITGALKKREGFRHLWLGDSGMGKTIANKSLIEWLQKLKRINMFLSVDDKNRWEAQYEGTYRINPEHLKSKPPGRIWKDGKLVKEDPNNIVFRGISYSDPDTGKAPFENVDINAVAEMAWDLVRLQPITVLVNLDELADATNGYQAWAKQNMPQTYRKGRAVGISIVATTQLPQLLPREAFGLSDTIGIFRMSSREAEYLKKFNVIGAEDVDAIANLKVGEFRLFRKSFPFDPNVYRYVLHSKKSDSKPNP